eukprot:6077859-Prymnesium_polylepis.1
MESRRRNLLHLRTCSSAHSGALVCTRARSPPALRGSKAHYARPSRCWRRPDSSRSECRQPTSALEAGGMEYERQRDQTSSSSNFLKPAQGTRGSLARSMSNQRHAATPPRRAIGGALG